MPELDLTEEQLRKLQIATEILCAFAMFCASILLVTMLYQVFAK